MFCSFNPHNSDHLQLVKLRFSESGMEKQVQEEGKLPFIGHLLYARCSFSLLTICPGRHECPHSIDAETEVQRGKLSCLGTYSS